MRGLSAHGCTYRIHPQFPIRDHRGFDWFWDLGVWVEGRTASQGAGLLIDVNGPEHLRQKRYGGPGGGYTRDYDKAWELGSQRWLKDGWDHLTVANEDCRLAGGKVTETAALIAERLLARAGLGGPTTYDEEEVV